MCVNFTDTEVFFAVRAGKIDRNVIFVGGSNADRILTFLRVAEEECGIVIVGEVVDG